MKIVAPIAGVLIALICGSAFAAQDQVCRKTGPAAGTCSASFELAQAAGSCPPEQPLDCQGTEYCCPAGKPLFCPYDQASDQYNKCLPADTDEDVYYWQANCNVGGVWCQ